MSVAVIVPWRPDGAERDRNWAFLRDQWAEHFPNWEIVEGHCPEGPWNKALAVADALKRTDAAVLVVADADIWCPEIAHAVRQVVSHPEYTWAVPHRKVYRLASEPTARLIDGRLNWDTLGYPKLAQGPYTGIAGGGLVVIRRDLYGKAPFDPRFNGWGGEDSAAGITWTALYGTPWRGTAPLWHLWHPPQKRLTRVCGSEASMALLNRYKTNRTRRHEIQAIVNEHKVLTRGVTMDG